MLDNLIDVLINRKYHTPEWLDAIGEELTDLTLAMGKVGEIIRLGAKVGVEEVTTRKLVVSFLKTNQLTWTDEKIDFLVTGIYDQHRKQEEVDRRRRAGLPPLK